MKEVFIVLGIEMGYIIALPCLQIIGGWRIVFGAALIPITIMLSGLVRCSVWYPLTKESMG